MCYIEKQCARSVGHVGGAFASEAEAHVVFGEHYRPNTFPILRFVLADPEQFRKRKIGQRRIACELDEALLADLGGQIAALLFSANVAPNQGGADDASLLVEHYCAVHLPGETDASNFFSTQIRAGDRFANRDTRGTPPVFRLLLGPADLRRSERLMLFRGGGDDAALAVDDEGASSSGTNIDSKNVDRASSTASVARTRYCKRAYLTSLVMRKSGRISKLAY